MPIQQLFSTFLLIILSHCLCAQNSDSSKFVVLSNLEAGFYENELKLELKSNQPGAKIYYTLNGTAATSRATPYKGPIVIQQTTVIKAVAYLGKEQSESFVATYFINEPPTALPVISISIKASILFNHSTGIYKKGPRAAKFFPYKGANYYSKREYACKVEFFETNKKRVYEGTLGLKIFGGMSRIFPQKSFALYARKKYGDKYIRYPIFPDRALKKYKRLVLRNSGSDYGGTHFRDAFITSLGREMGLPVQAYRPALVYVNGRYWGILNIREKLTKHYFQQHFGVHKDSLDLMEHRRYVQAGKRRHYEKMQAYMRKYPLSDPTHFEKVERMMDVDNFMEYQIMQIYIDNQDAGGNIKFWRPQTDTGRWQWVLFDTDFGFGHYSKGGYAFNSIAFHTASNGPAWPNPPWSTFNLRMLLKNKDFRKRFVTRFCDRLNSSFRSDYVLARIDSLSKGIEAELPRHWKRWGLSPEDWDQRVKKMKTFAQKRPSYILKHLKKEFPELGKEVKVEILTKGSGHLLLNNLIPIHSVFRGSYFQQLELSLKADAYFGHQFSHWEINGQRVPQRNIVVELSQEKMQIKAIFEQGEHKDAAKVIINEISCRDSLVSDWIEFYNSTNEDLNLENWYLLDEKKHQYTFPNISIKAGDYLILCQDSSKFRRVFRAQENLLSGLSFGLGRKSDRLELYNPSGEPIDSVAYKIGKSKDSLLLSLALRDFESDNSLRKNWKYDRHGGSPGSMNPQYLIWKNKAQSASDDGDSLSVFMNSVRAALVATGIFAGILITYIVRRKKLLPRQK